MKTQAALDGRDRAARQLTSPTPQPEDPGPQASMSTELTCFLFGTVATAFWGLGIAKGVAPRLVWSSAPFLVRKAESPVRYWIAVAFWGCLALGFLVLPVLAWLGLRGK